MNKIKVQEIILYLNYILFFELFIVFNTFFRGGSLGFLFGVAGAGATEVLTDVNANGEGFVVIWAFLFHYSVGRSDAVDFLGEFLEV